MKVFPPKGMPRVVGGDRHSVGGHSVKTSTRMVFVLNESYIFAQFINRTFIQNDNLKWKSLQK